MVLHMALSDMVLDTAALLSTVKDMACPHITVHHTLGMVFAHTMAHMGQPLTMAKDTVPSQAVHMPQPMANTRRIE